MSSGMRAKPRPLDGKRPDRCQVWQLSVNLGRDEDGRYRRKTQVFHGSRRAAIEAMEAMRRQYEGVRITSTSAGLTFAEAAQKWIDQQVAFQDVTEATGRKKRDYLRMVSRHIGDMTLDQISTSVINDAYQSMLMGNTTTGRKLSMTTMACVSRTVKQFLHDMAKDGAMPPLDGLRTFQERSKERKAMSDEEVDALFAKLDVSDHRHVAVALYVGAGLRRAEALTLTWQDYEPETGLLHVHGTKSAAANSVVPLGFRVRRILDAWSAIQGLRFDLLGVERPSDCLIVSQIGERMEPHSMGRWWTRHRSELGCPDYCLHELRHTFATTLARHDVTTVKAAALLRDKDTRTVEKVYTHLKVSELMDTVAELDKVL